MDKVLIMISRLKKNNKLIKTSASISNDFDSFSLQSGDIIAFGCRLVNNKPWYQVYQEGLYNTSSYYDGPNYDKALRIYKDLMTAFNGIDTTENFVCSESKIKNTIESLITEDKEDKYTFQMLKSDPLFLGVNRDDF